VARKLEQPVVRAEPRAPAERASGKHLENVIELGKDLGEIDAKEDPAAFAEKQAEFQAANQIFKMFQESISTLVKSLGEGITTMARKQ